MMKILNFFCLGLMLLFFSACVFEPHQKNEKVDMLLYNGEIYTKFAKPDFTDAAKNNKPYTVEAIAISNEKIVFTGTNAESKKYKAKEKVNNIDLKGAIIIPGLIDAHVHPVLGGIKETSESSFPFVTMPDEIGKKIKNAWNPKYVQNLIGKSADGETVVKWIVGGQWNSEFFDGNGQWNEGKRQVKHV